jgi:hypothetical protein
MPGRHSSLVVRVLLVPLVVLAPLGALAAFALLFPSAPDGLGPVLLMLYFFYAIVAIMLLPALFWARGSSPGPSGGGADGGDMDPRRQPPRPARRAEVFRCRMPNRRAGVYVTMIALTPAWDRREGPHRSPSAPRSRRHRLISSGVNRSSYSVERHQTTES